jgi:hypothetical protein
MVHQLLGGVNTEGSVNSLMAAFQKEKDQLNLRNKTEKEVLEKKL